MRRDRRGRPCRRRVLVEQIADGSLTIEHVSEDGTRLYAWRTEDGGLHTLRTDRGGDFARPFDLRPCDAWFLEFARELVGLVSITW